MRSRGLVLTEEELKELFFGGLKQIVRPLVGMGFGVCTNQIIWSGTAQKFIPWEWDRSSSRGHKTGPAFACPYGQVGEALWVKEKVWLGFNSEVLAYDVQLSQHTREDIKQKGAVLRAAYAIHQSHSRTQLRLTSIEVFSSPKDPSNEMLVNPWFWRVGVEVLT